MVTANFSTLCSFKSWWPWPYIKLYIPVHQFLPVQIYLVFKSVKSLIFCIILWSWILHSDINASVKEYTRSMPVINIANCDYGKRKILKSHMTFQLQCCLTFSAIKTSGCFLWKLHFYVYLIPQAVSCVVCLQSRSEQEGNNNWYCLNRKLYSHIVK